MTQQNDSSYNYSYVYDQPPHKRQYHIRWSPKEVKHLSVAIALVIGVGLSLGVYNFLSVWSWGAIGTFACIITGSFLAHEIAHKIMAQKAGMWAEFRLTTWGAVLTLIAVFLPVKIIAPGAMMIGGTPPSAKNMIKIASAGIIVNMILATILLCLAFGLPIAGLPVNDYTWMLFFSAYLNSFMAIFNLLPVGIFDGYKIFMLNKKAWGITIILSGILLVVTGWITFIGF
jgi:Zn-dependent protease